MNFVKSPKWKYQTPQKKRVYDFYLKLDDEKPTKLLITDWNFNKNQYNDSLFSCSIKAINGEKADKVWTVWDFDLKEALKKKLKSHKPNKDQIEITVVKHEKDMEESFELK
jgi:hypothetical protein